MLVIDDSKLKLLKMKEKILELSTNIDTKALNEYRDLAVAIDDYCYQTIIKEIKDSNYNNLPLEEQIGVLRGILDDYNYFNEMQCNFRNTYSKYSNSGLSLTDISNILVDNIQNRISQIEGYLMNIKNLKSNKIELDRLNQSLIAAVDGKKQTAELIMNIREKLKLDVLNSRGRIYADDNRLEVTNISIELSNFGINLNDIISNDELLNTVYSDALNEKKEKLETLNTALSLPNKDDAICGMYMFELLKSNYKFTLVELIKEIMNSNTDYYLFKDSLYKIEDLIKEIKNNLKELNVKFYINPFDQIKIKDYICVFEKTKDYEIDINAIKQTMTYLADMIDEMEKRNNEFLLSINDEVTILREDINTLYLSIPKEDVNVLEGDDSITEILKTADVKANQVIRVKQPVIGFMKGRVKEKTNSVIKRVFEMFCQKEKKEVIPDLVVEKLQAIQETVPNEEQKNNEIELFQEVEPFLEPTLFEDRIDSEIFSDNSNRQINLSSSEPKTVIEQTEDVKEDAVEDKMPELFWTPKEEEETSKVESFDEQVEKLIKRR